MSKIDTIERPVKRSAPSMQELLDTLTLSPQHVADQARSGITKEQAIAAGIRTVTNRATSASILNWDNPADCLGSCMLFTFRDECGKLLDDYARLKPDKPRERKKQDGTKEPIKYESPYGSSNHAYFPTGISLSLHDATIPLIVTEGEKKALKAMLAGFPAIGITGVESWSVKREEDPTTGRKIGERKLIPSLDAVTWQGRRVTIVFDSDAKRKPEVRRAEIALGKALAAQGADVFILRLPDKDTTTPDDLKQGLDDYLVMNRADELQVLLAHGCRSLKESAAALKAEVSTAASSGSQSGTQIILAYFIERYQPVFRRGNTVCCRDGSEMAMGVATAVPDSILIDRLATANDAPKIKDIMVNRAALPNFFRTWAKVAWGDLLRSLPDEDSVTPDDEAPAREEFRRLVRDAMLSEVVLGDIIGHEGVTQTERRSLIDWCEKFAKPGPWKSIRSKKCWCRIRPLPGDEIELMVAIRHELFAQLRADRRLCEMGANAFGRRAAKYGVGKSSRESRPGGESAVLLDAEFIADLTSTIHDSDAEGEQAQHDKLEITKPLRSACHVEVAPELDVSPSVIGI